jgi:hypothetical protein
MFYIIIGNVENYIFQMVSTEGRQLINQSSPFFILQSTSNAWRHVGSRVRTWNFSCLQFTWSHIRVSPLVVATCLARHLPPLIPPLLFPVSMDPGCLPLLTCCRTPGEWEPLQALSARAPGHPSPMPQLSLSGLPSPPPHHSGRGTFTKVKFIRNVETKELLCGEPIQSRFALLYGLTIRSVSCLDLMVVVDLLVCVEWVCIGAR